MDGPRVQGPVVEPRRELSPPEEQHIRVDSHLLGHRPTIRRRDDDPHHPQPDSPATVRMSQWAFAVPLEGLEPPTLSLGRNCSSIELQRLTARVYRLAIACSAAHDAPANAAQPREERATWRRRRRRGSGSERRRSAPSDRRLAASGRWMSGPTARRRSAIPSTSDRTRCTSRSPRRRACSASCTSSPTGWSRPGRSRATRSGRSGCPARRMPQTRATSPSTSRARGSSRPTTRAGASRRIRWHRMSRPTPRTPSCSRAQARIANGRRHRTRTRRWSTPPGTGCSCPTSVPTACACSGSARCPPTLAHDASADLVIHAGAGPRHLVIAGDLAVVANELDRSASLIDLVQGREVAWFPVDERVEARGLGLSAIRLTRSGHGARRRPRCRRARRAAPRRRRRHARARRVGADGRAASARPAPHARRAVRARRRPGRRTRSPWWRSTDGVPTEVVSTIGTPAPACLARVP